MRQVLEKLRGPGLQADISKREFFVTEIEFLGQTVGPNSIQVDPLESRL
jgi:hypothetical protein